jgi:hypothetical protein
MYSRIRPQRLKDLNKTSINDNSVPQVTKGGGLVVTCADDDIVFYIEE